MTIGRIVVDLAARTGAFETDLARAAKTAERRAKDIDAAVAKAGTAVGAAFASAGVAAVYFGKQLIDGLDALNDVKDATGSSIENISALEDVALRTGTSLDAVSGIMVKFNNVLKEADGKNAAGQALKALGLSAEELKKIDPAEALRQTAVALTNFADDGQKARLVQELFGKSVKEAAPFLKDLAEQTELVGKVTGEQAQQAEDFNKALFALQKNAADAGRSLLQNLLPAMNEILKAFNAGGLTSAIDTFGNKVFNWESNAHKKGISVLKADIAELQDAANNITFDIFGQKGKIQQDIAAKTAALREAERAFLNSSDKNYEAQGGVNPMAADTRPSVGDTKTGGSKTGGSKTPRESELQRYLESLEKQLQKVNELTTAEKLLDDIRTGHLKLQKGESLDRALALAKQVDSLKAMAEYTKLAQEAEKQREEVLLKAATAQEEQVKSLTEGNKALQEETEMIGKNAEAQAAIEAARISSAIAIKEQALAEAENAGALARTTDAIREQIRLLTERKDLVVQKGVTEKLAEDSKKAEDFAKSVGAAFESSFEKAILEGDKLSDVLKGLVKDIAALYIRNSITGPLAQAIGGAAGGGGGFDFGKILAGAGSWFGGFFADGGSPPMGKVSVVGENGPELFVPNTAGSIVPNHAIGGGQRVTVVQNFTVGDVATISQVREAVAGSERRIAGTIGRSQRYGGAMAA
jgi:hypothetical protein